MPKSETTSSPSDRRNADYSAEGVDRTLIRWFLSLTPAERLRVVQDQANAIREVRAREDGD